MTPDAVRGLVFDDNARVQREFIRRWSPEIDRALAFISAAHAGLKTYRGAVAANLRNAEVEAFLHSAHYSLIAALHHLVSGYPVAAGHMQRHYLESVAMTALCIDAQSGVFEAWHKDKGHYPVHQAPTKLRQKKVRKRLEALIAFNPSGWESILKMARDFESRSHASGLTLAYQTLFEEENMVVLGGEFDPAKEVAYRADLRRIAGAAKLLEKLAAAAATVLRKMPGEEEGPE